MPHPLHPSLHDADPTEMCRLDFRVGTVIEDTGKEVEEIFGVSHDGTRDKKSNKVYHDPDGVGLLVEIDPKGAKIQQFVSLFFRGILPTTEIVREPSLKGKGKKKYYSLAFNPESMHRGYSEAECIAGGLILEAFGDGDHYYIPDMDARFNIVKKGSKHYFYDFHLKRTPLKEFPPEEIPHEGFGFMRKDVREAFFRIIEALQARYDGESGKTHFFAIGRKAGLPERNIEILWGRFMSQLEKLSRLDSATLDTWEEANRKYL